MAENTKNGRDDDDERRALDLTLHVFAISSGMVGVCLTGIGLLRVVVAQTNLVIYDDDLLAIDAVMFLFCCGLAFFSYKAPPGIRRRRLRTVVDVLFMMALAVMVVVCATIAFALL